MNDEIDHQKLEQIVKQVLSDEGHVEGMLAFGKLDFTSLLSLLQHPHRFIQHYAIEFLGRTNNCEAVKPLIAFLDSADCSNCANAAGGLGELGAPQAIEPLIKVLNDTYNKDWCEEDKSGVRIIIIGALAKLGATKALPFLIWIQANDKGKTLRGAEVADVATWAIEKLLTR